MFKIYWTDRDGMPNSVDEEDLGAALRMTKEMRDAGMTFVTMVSENPNSIGKPGVDAVENGKTPDGHQYEWSKAGRAGKTRRGR
jgi:hypothetical protein